MESALTPSQRLLMEETYHCYERYCRRLYGDDFIDAAMDGFIAAVRRYDQMPPAVKAALPVQAVCMRKMRDSVWLHLRKTERRMEKAKMTSMDAILEDRGYIPPCFSSPLPSLEEDVNAKLLLSSISALLSGDEVKIMVLQANGYSRQDIAQAMGMTLSALDRRLAHARSLVRRANWSWGGAPG